MERKEKKGKRRGLLCVRAQLTPHGRDKGK